MTEQIKLPCIVAIDDNAREGEVGCTIQIPDLSISVEGSNFVEAMAIAVETATGMFYYYREHNVPFPQKTTWEEVDKECRKSDKFPTHVVVL